MSFGVTNPADLTEGEKASIQSVEFITTDNQGNFKSVGIVRLPIDEVLTTLRIQQKHFNFSYTHLGRAYILLKVRETIATPKQVAYV